MPFSTGNTLGSAQSKTANQASTPLTTIAEAVERSLAVLIVAVENNQTTDGDEGSVTSVTDTGSNSWNKVIE